MNKLYFVTLGCAKNRVDTEWLVSLLRGTAELVDEPDKADFLLVNTCAFIEDAREESVDTLLELGARKLDHQRLIVLGCLPQRYSADLAQSLPEADLLVGTSRLGDLPRLLAEKATGLHADPGAGSWLPEAPLPRASTLSGPAAYLKVAEGCDRRCAYCAVPLIRGGRHSLPLAHLVEEARMLVEAGARELNLIAQDLSSWGRDLSPPSRLIDLVRELSALQGLSWIRLLYLYPTAVLEADFAELFTVPRVVPYVDMPLQHVATPVLEAMGRGYDGPTAREVVKMVQKLPQHVFVRTTFLVGHPGETEEAFAELEAFVKETGFHHLGVFAYSPEEGTRAHGLPCVDRATAEARRDRLMALQQKVSTRLVKKLKGRTVQVLVEKFDAENWIWTGRHAGQAPEVDGHVILTNCDCRAGDFIPVRVVETDAYDLVGTP
ncbi:MAG: 30S ribosomal protein S12 methylthiotransferase RimO [Deltaproteobacteria bacterium HGW-Deltaproteobacteria-22]|jgi:ribosomal protein S12 methylthiotransferase|nr:MAG: 30S ribosomal protein S12 methylthiotransferase RimO [Deltaproteobacteria bacterium HGW-Deltaproteobacteria-22]